MTGIKTLPKLFKNTYFGPKQDDFISEYGNAFGKRFFTIVVHEIFDNVDGKPCEL